MDITRFAPSPTGALHLGNARTFLINWLIARSQGQRILFRLEDLDGPRIKRGAADEIVQDLHYLGLDWDELSPSQSSRQQIYDAVILDLLAKKLAYPCICTRREVEVAASAPHAEDGSAIYPGVCKGRFSSVSEAFAVSGRNPAIRFAAPDQTIEFVDQFHGPRHWNVLQQLGDFVIAKADSTAAYQLAVVVDDCISHVTHVVRGDDLLDSTPRQILLYQAMNMHSRVPTYTHLPLVVGADGRRLAKRHGDTRISQYRLANVPAERMLALLARWCGLGQFDRVDHPRDLVKSFDLSKIPREPIVFTETDHHWLLQTP